jgi:FixJ family two-component response regulator
LKEPVVLTHRKVVAIVEDDPDMRKGIVRLLNVYGFDTIAFPSAEAFLDEKAANEAVCLVLDIHLSGMTGIELRRRMSASGSTLPVIFVTAVDDEATRVEALDTGCIAFLRKPFAASLLIGAIDKALH